jgi:hypothetical protein
MNEKNTLLIYFLEQQKQNVTFAPYFNEYN